MVVAQDDEIKETLTARGEWDPPWLRNRMPRGPPSTPGQDGEVIWEAFVDQPPPDEEYLDQPPRNEDWES